MELSVIIPARNEEFLLNTVEEALKKSGETTECIVVLDGYWATPSLPQHERLIVIHNEESVGQRAAINQAARVSRAKYIMKLDAHCTLDNHFDRKLIESAKELGREVVQVPTQYNLHVYDWVCPDGHRRYQSPDGPCKDCGKETTKEMVWKKREHKKTYAWRFDKDLKFAYWSEYEKKHQEEKYLETMSLLGACFFLERDYYWELGGSDEGHGSWGQQGTEIACKTWLSGGRLICNRKTWFSHFFRTGEIGFPYPLSGKDQEKAREYSNDIWKNNKWSKQIHNLDWLINKFQTL